MTPVSRLAAVAASVLALVSVTACGGDTPSGDPTAGTSASSEPAATGTPAPTTVAPPVATGNLDGTLFFIGIGTSAGGLYYLHNDAYTLVISDTSFGFYQSATMSPNGKKLAWIPNDSAGGTAQVKVQTYGGGTATVAPASTNNGYLPQWSADSSSLIVNYDNTKWGRVDVTSGVLTPMPSASGCCFGVFSPDGAYAILRNGANTSVVHADGSGPVPAAAPAGQVFIRIQSLSPDGRHVIALVRPAGSPAGDAARTVAANAIIDTVTGTSVALSDGATIKSGFYRADGNAVLRVTAGGADKVRLVSPAGAVLDEVTVPAAAASQVLIGYAP